MSKGSEGAGWTQQAEKTMGSHESLTRKYDVDRTTEVLDGKESWVTTVKIPGDVAPKLLYDPDLEKEGIVTEPGGLLIDQKATAERLGRMAGYKPEEYLADIANGIAMMGGHFGWQREAFLVENGSLVTIANDSESLTGHYDTLLHDETGWGVRRIFVNRGTVMPESQKKISGASGFNGAQIVRNGAVVSMDDIVGDPRVVADARAVVDFSGGSKVPGDFFQDVRKVPIDAHKLRSLGRGALTTFRLDRTDEPATEKALDRLEEGVGNIPAWRTHDTDSQRLMAITEPLPAQKVPLLGYGCDGEGNLVIVAVDGRQPGSAGAYIAELAGLMVERGVVDGILGAGGGDVAVVEKTEGRSELLNSPANVDPQTGERVTRRVPNLVIF